MLEFNPFDLKSMCKLMDEYGNSQEAKFGINENGETVEICISKDNITVYTSQNNGWIRKNTYWRDGTTEETFKGK